MSQPIQALDPDYVLSISYPLLNEERGIPEHDAKVHLKNLITTLYNYGFSVQIRNGTTKPPTLLIFIKLSSYKYIEAFEKDLIQNYEFGVTNKENSKSEKLRIIYHYLITPVKFGGVGITPNKGNWSFVHSIIPVSESFHDTTLKQDVETHITNTSKNLLSTNLIKEKFGVQISLYFEFVKFYIFALSILSVLGFTSYLKSGGKIYSLTYAFINLIWGILFITFWNRKQQYLVNFWGVQNSHLIEEFNSKLSQVNEKFEQSSSFKHKDNDDAYRYLKQLTFIPIAVLFTVLLVSFQLFCFVIEIFLTDVYDGPGKSLLTLIPTILLSVFVPVLTIVYNLVGDFLINWEDHDNIYSQNQSILIKTFVLNFLTSYMPLLITSFVYLPFAHLIKPHLLDIKASIGNTIGENRFYYKYLTQLKKQEDFKINQDRLNAQFYYFIVTNSIIQLILKYGLPLILQFVFKLIKDFLNKPKAGEESSKEKKLVIEDNETEGPWLDNVRKSIELPEYNVNDDFRSIIIQYGYLIMFGPVWTLAPIVALIFNVITFNLDLIKLSTGKYFRPPIPTRVDSIHPWNYALFLLTWFGSIVSPIVTVFYRHGVAPPKTLGQLAFDKASVNVSSTVELLFVLLASEHLFLFSYNVFEKLSNLYKSKVEWENDFVENDIKLRHDYYSGKVKPHFSADETDPWAGYTAKSNIESINAFPVKPIAYVAPPIVAAPVPTAPVPTETIIPKVDGKNGVSTSAEPSITKATSRISKPFQTKDVGATFEATKGKVTDTMAANLEKVKDADDRIITSKNNQDQLQYATIDNNKHIKPQDVADAAKAIETSAKNPTVDTATAAKDATTKVISGVKDAVTPAVASKVEDDANDDADVSKADTTFQTIDSDYSDSIKNIKKAAKDTADSLSSDKSKKKSSLKKLFKSSSSSSTKK
ncbi:calcium-activated chloride channel-domain-containing protein [Scheffersomyces coipomensis]|uniref:calcium-activated chloride channel-domain-containing protein n=1 Tax=Scheffersomyces coipomensis TaxID=1788519 RepID=UPI00315CA355